MKIIYNGDITARVNFCQQGIQWVTVFLYLNEPEQTNEAELCQNFSYAGRLYPQPIILYLKVMYISTQILSLGLEHSCDIPCFIFFDSCQLSIEQNDVTFQFSLTNYQSLTRLHFPEFL